MSSLHSTHQGTSLLADRAQSIVFRPDHQTKRRYEIDSSERRRILSDTEFTTIKNWIHMFCAEPTRFVVKQMLQYKSSNGGSSI